MSSRLYVGNLSNEVTEAELKQFFSAYGTVVSIRIKMDSVTGEPWGYGFVEMADADSAEAALKGANGQKLGKNRLGMDVTRSS